MFAVITGSAHWKSIENVVNSMDEEIIYKSIEEDKDIITELENVSRLPVKILFIDYSLFKDNTKLIQGIRRLRIKKDKIRIVILAQGSLPGDPILSTLVTMGIYDILTDLEDIDKVENVILDVIQNPTTYAKAVKWDIGTEINFTTEEHKKAKTKEEIQIKTEITERTVTITKEKIIGTVVIAISGTMNRIGTTHHSISIAKFLSNSQFKVALFELHDSNHFSLIKSAYDEIEEYENYFKLSNIDFYPYNDKITVLDLLQHDYNYIVLDLGTYDECNLDEFNRANKKIILSGVKDWEVSHLESILSNNNNIYISKCQYAFNFADNEIFDFVKSNMDKLECHKMGYNPNPFNISKEVQVVFLKMLGDILPSESNNIKSRGKSIFSNILKKGKIKSDVYEEE